jgi:hypothetical protein
MMMPYPFRPDPIEVSKYQIAIRLVQLERDRKKEDLMFEEFLKTIFKVKE